MTFARRVISLTFTLGGGSTFANSSNTVTVTGLRVQAQIDKVVGPGMGTLNMRVYGLTPDILNQLSALNQGAESYKQNMVTVQAGNEGEILSTVFQGQILVGQQNLNAQPDVSLLIVAAAGQLQAVQVVQPSSYTGGVSAATVMQDLARISKPALQFENNGVTTQLSRPYYPGSPRDQMRACAEDAKINWIIDDGGAGSGAQNTLAIWPRNGSRSGQIPVISKATGMIGYPDYSTSLNGLTVSTLFNPYIRVGGLVKLESELLVANGTWLTYDISHTLESETPGGQWMTRFGCSSIPPKNG